MGATHGLFCLGCCWGIMAVLFVVGLMNLGWMAALSLLIVAEKLAPRGVAIGRAAGALFVALGVLMGLQPGLFPASGLAMSSAGTQMAGMVGSGAPTNARTSYRALAGPYALTLTLGPAKAMLTPAQARRTHARSGDVTLDSMMPGAMARGGVQHYLELRVVDRVMGMAVTDARVTVGIQGAGAPHGSLMLARMYGAKEGMKNLHYGTNVSLGRGAYMVRVRVDGRLTDFHVRVS
jgi:hypothetical protein